MTRSLVVALLATTLLLAAGARPAVAADRKVIGVSLLTETNPFFVDIGKAIRAEAAKHDMDVIIVAGENDPAKQKDQVADFLVKHVAAIILCPCDSKSIGTSITDANKAGIPVFTADIAALGGPNVKVVSHIATDNQGGGKLAGEALIKAIGGSGKVAILDQPEIESVLMRTKGFEEAVAEHNAKGGGQVTIVAKLPGGGAKDKSFKATEDVLQSHPDVTGIFGINDPSALGAVAALEKAGKAGQVKVVGFDGQPEGRAAIKAGKIYADAVQSPAQIGTGAVDDIVAYLNGDDVPAKTLIPTTLYTQADAEKDPTLK